MRIDKGEESGQGWGPGGPPQNGAPESYRGFRLDPFQREAIGYILQGDSVLVAAPTGTGKTLIADYLIEREHRLGRKVVYTAPIKALSNQKFKEFKALLGEGHVGILTGDVVIRPEAPVVIMTTEIFRNLLHLEPHRVADVSYCIFDEIHYIDDPARGSVWEECLIFMPPGMRFLGLSATIPNLEELAEWIRTVQGQTVQVVRHDQRAVPLRHGVFEVSLGLTTFDKLLRRYRRHARRLGLGGEDRPLSQLAFPRTTHLDLVAHIKDGYLPCLFFTFSRRKCEENARELAEHEDFLGPEEKARVAEAVARHAARYGVGGTSRLKALQSLLSRGIGYHHAGLLPMVKDIVEELFEERLIKVLYCTETFAVGLNFPCRTVCFDSYTKWDGVNFRPITNREYFQMTGRAGRRGIDEEGFAFMLVDFNYFVPGEFPIMREDQIEPLQSRFQLSYNTVLNLVRSYTEAEIGAVLEKNFAAFQQRRQREALNAQLEALRERLARGPAADPEAGTPARHRGRKGGARARQERQLQRSIRRLSAKLRDLPPETRFVDEFRAKKALLEALDYIRDGELTPRGRLAAQLNVQELLMTEFYFDGYFHEWDVDQINAVAVAVDYEPRRHEGRPRHNVFDVARVRSLVRFLEEMEAPYGEPTVRFNDHLSWSAYRWSQGAPFDELLAGAYVDEGDIVYAFRRGIDVLRQLRNAVRDDASLAGKLQECITRMDRDEVSIVL